MTPVRLSAYEKPVVLPKVPDEILFVNGPCARLSNFDAEDLEVRGLPHRTAYGSVIAYDEREAPFLSIPEFTAPGGPGQIRPGGIAVMDFSRHYCIHIFYDFRGKTEQDLLERHWQSMATDGAVLSGYHPAAVFFHRGPDPDVVLSALLPMPQFPGILTPAGLRQSLRIRIAQGREHAGKIHRSRDSGENKAS